MHIGFHKTATTWFQRSVYPHVTSHAYVPRGRVNRAVLEATAFHFDPSNSRELLALAPDVAPILCEEALSGSLLGGGFMGFQSAQIAHRLRALLPSARIVVFVRSQPEMIAATYLQYVRSGGTYAPHRFLWSSDYARVGVVAPRREARFSFDHFDYDRLIAHYVALFGAKSVFVYAYEDLLRDGRAFLERFAKELELEIELPAVSMAKRNASYSLAVSRIARVLNLFTAHGGGDKRHWVHIPYWYEARKRLLETMSGSRLLGARPTPERLLGDGTVRWIRQRYWESNRRLAELSRLDLRELGYAVDPPAAPTPRPDGGVRRLWASH